ncbi:hypothetical protein LTR53_017578, partial [Teratosphaeriaceae sp. CCFEE 6253]
MRVDLPSTRTHGSSRPPTHRVTGTCLLTLRQEFSPPVSPPSPTTFVRLLTGDSDTLKRHLALHGPAAAEAYAASNKSTRACRPCAKAKQRCNAANPCERCIFKSINCVYRGTDGQEEQSASESESPVVAPHPQVGEVDVSQSLTTSDTGAPLADETTPELTEMLIAGSDSWANLGDMETEIDWTYPFTFPALGNNDGITEVLGTWSRQPPSQRQAHQLESLPVSPPESFDHANVARPTLVEQGWNSGIIPATGQASSSDMVPSQDDDDDVLDAERLTHVP